jgi:hypothetical protein
MKSKLFASLLGGVCLLVAGGLFVSSGCTPAESSKEATRLTPENVAGTSDVTSEPVPATPATVDEQRGQGTMEPRQGLVD